MDDISQEATGDQRRRMALLSLFAALAVGLAALGLYGLLSYLVGQRQREIGVRLALGATPGEILGLVVRGGMTLTLAGVALGIVGSLLAGRLILNLLYGVRSWEPDILAASATVLIAVAILGCYFPARRASQVDPMEALRIE
jgi:ABC-type antimicrobial peptide transport system permease subunit